MSAAPSIAAVLAATAVEYGMTVDALLARTQVAAVVQPRQVAMHLAIEMTGKTTVQIARVTGRDHTTVIHAHATIARLVTQSPALAARVAAIAAALTQQEAA
jgi:chromosomal replication initiator protein